MSARLSTLVLVGTIALGTLLGACDHVPPPRFAHAAHLTGIPWGGPGKTKWLVCTTCHAGIREARERAYPDPALCERCHANDGKGTLPPATTATLETSAAARAIRFTHDKHLRIAEINGQCTGCHDGVSDATGHAPRFPPMKTCERCHESDLAEARCALCHDPRDLAELVPQTFLRHDDGWARRHGPSAAREAMVCNQCHSEAQCKDCHDTSQPISIESRRPDAVRATFVHRGDFLTRHALEARSQGGACVRCHAPSSCDSCHVMRGVSANAVGSTNPHPLGWLGPDTASQNYHGRAARHDIVSCAACHDRGPATNCILCHRVGGPGGNPHPRGWSSSRSPGASTCRLCHGS